VLSSEQAAEEVVGQLARNFPVYRTQIARILLRIVQTRKTSGAVGTLVLVVFASPLLGAARLVMHRMLGIRSGRSFVRNVVVNAGMVLLLGIFLFAIIVMTWILQWVQELLEPVHVPGQWIRWATLAISLGLSSAMFYLGYRYMPYRRVGVGPALAGGIVAAILWEIAKQLFRLYIRQVGVYDQIYGLCAAVAGLAQGGSHDPQGQGGSGHRSSTWNRARDRPLDGPARRPRGGERLRRLRGRAGHDPGAGERRRRRDPEGRWPGRRELR